MKGLEEFEGKALVVKVVRSGEEKGGKRIIPINGYSFLVMRQKVYYGKVVNFYIPREVAEFLRSWVRDTGRTLAGTVRSIVFSEDIPVLDLVELYERGRRPKKMGVQLSEKDFLRLKELARQHNMPMSSFIAGKVISWYERQKHAGKV